MKRFYYLSLLCCIHHTTSQLAATPRRPPKSPCESSGKNSLVEHFFNVIFTEFYNTPPVCVCVQMCAGQSTYCYPNGCLKSAVAAHEGTEGTATVPATAPPEIQKNKNQFMLVKDEKYDFMSEFLERNYVDDSKMLTQNNNNPLIKMRPDPFKDKYSVLGKYKRVPKIELGYNLKDKVKNIKSEIGKIEGFDLSKTRWPMNWQNTRSGHKLFTDIEKPLIGKANFFTTMLSDNEVAEYPPKYFKRDLTKTVDDDDGSINAFYILDALVTDNKTLSLETLIDNLIKSSFVPKKSNLDETAVNLVNSKRDEIEIETEPTTEKFINANLTGLANETTRVISINLNNENVDKNKYVDDTIRTNKTSNINEMITHLAKEIEEQNNTSMEIAKRLVIDFDETTLNSSNHENISDVNNYTTASIEPEMNETMVPALALQTETTTQKEVKVTKKNRQRVVKKQVSSKIN